MNGAGLPILRPWQRRMIALTLTLLLCGSALAQRIKAPEHLRLYQEAQTHRLNAERFAKNKSTKEAAEQRAKARVKLLRAVKLAPDFINAIEALSGVLNAMKRHKEAVTILKKALKTSPSALALKNELGIHLFRLGRHDEGEKKLLEVTRKSKRFLTAHYTLAAHYYRTEEWAKALPHAQAYIKKRPNKIVMRGLLGNLALRLNKLELALRSFKTVLRLDKTNIAVQVNLGSVFFKLKDYKQAIKQFNAILKARPEIGLVHNNLGNCYFELKDWRAAADHYLSFIQVEPSNARGHYRAGISLHKLKEKEEALRLLTRAAELDPKDPWALYKMAQITMLDKRLSQAERFAAQAERRRPQDSRILILGGQIARRRKNFGKAIQVFERALEIDTRNAEIYAELGYARILSGQINPGILTLEKGFSLGPKNIKIKQWLPTSLIHRAISQLQGGALKGAEKDLRRALVINPAQIDAAWNLVFLLDLSKRTKEAFQVVSSALKRAPKNPDLHLVLALLFVRRNEVSKAQKALMLAKGANDVALRWLVQGAIHAIFGEYDPAISAFAEAKKRGLEQGEALYAIQLSHAAHLISKAHYRAAANLLKRLRAPINPKHEPVRAALLAITYLNMQVGFEQIPALLKRVRRNLSNSHWGLKLFNRDIELIAGYTHYRLGNEQKAQKHLELHLKKHSTDNRGKRLLASVLGELAERDYVAHRYAIAAHRIRLALHLMPNVKRLKHNLACVRYSRGEHVEASRVFSALREDREIPEAALNLGLYLDDVMGQGNRALSLYQEYLKHGGIASEVARRRIRRKERIFGR